MGMFDVLKIAANIAKESGKLELQGEILGVYEKLLEQQKKITDLEEDNKILKDKLDLKHKLHFERNAYWIIDGEKKDGPFCTKCKDSNDKMIRLRVGNYEYMGWANCPNCKEYANN
jgi:hypothetical protein